MTDEKIAEIAARMEASDPTDKFWRDFARAVLAADQEGAQPVAQRLAEEIARNERVATMLLASDREGCMQWAKDVVATLETGESRFVVDVEPIQEHQNE